MNHIMLDLETFGTKPGSVIRSIGAVVFCLDGSMGPEFYHNIDEGSCVAAGLTKDPATVKWWSQQSKEAQDSLLVDPRPLPWVVADFHGWFIANGGSQGRVWAQGANFDPALWEAAAVAVKNPVPWKFWNARDTRTVYDIANLNTASIPRAGTYHNALDDAKHQVRCVAKAVAQAFNGGIAK
jgi:hypothetical protein